MKSLAWTTLAVAALVIMGCNLTGKYTVGGDLTGLRGQGLVLEDNSGNDLSLASNGAFVFSSGIKNGDAYSVTVRTQPSNPSQTCTVNNGSGTIDKANVTNVVVSCSQAGRFAYVANQLSNNLSAYSIDSARQSSITPRQPAATLNRPPTRASIAIARPSPSAPSRFAAGIA